MPQADRTSSSASVGNCLRSPTERTTLGPGREGWSDVRGSTSGTSSLSSGDGGAMTDVIAPPPGELFSETNDNSVAILLNYGTARVLLAGDAEAKEEEYMANGPYTT